jgi:predicted nuclease of predicted toxin-antitoxin system
VKLLADMGISMATVHALREAGEDIVHLREEALQRMPDDRILAKAIEERRIVVTCDLDFGDLLAAAGGVTPSVVLFRTRNQTPASVTPRLLQVLRTCGLALEAGAIVIVENAGFRVRHLPIHRE